MTPLETPTPIQETAVPVQLIAAASCCPGCCDDGDQSLAGEPPCC